MNKTYSPKSAGYAVLLGLAATSAAFASSDIVAVYSRTWNGYKRAVLPDNSIKPEYYAFAEGGRRDGIEVDKSIDDLPFLSIAHTVAVPLKQQNYLTSLDPKKTDLLIFVYWGTTTGAEDGQYSKTRPTLQTAFQDFQRMTGSLPHQSADAPAADFSPQAAVAEAAESELGQAMLVNNMENRERDANNWRNAGILGFREELWSAWNVDWFTPSKLLVEELEADRYYVVLKAYDFKTLAYQHKLKILWETRYSIRSRNNRFDEQLAGMTKFASQFFGQDVKRLVRRPMREGRVEIGAPRVIEMPAAK